MPPRDRHDRNAQERWERRRDRQRTVNQDPVDTELFMDTDVTPPEQTVIAVELTPSRVSDDMDEIEVVANLSSRRRVPGYWRTRDGRFILIRDMEDSHLENSINMIRRSAEDRGRRVSPSGVYSELIREQQRRQAQPADIIPSTVVLTPPDSSPEQRRTVAAYMAADIAATYDRLPPLTPRFDASMVALRNFIESRARDAEERQRAVEARHEQQNQLRSLVNIPAQLEIEIDAIEHLIRIGNNSYRFDLDDTSTAYRFKVVLLEPVLPTETKDEPQQGRRIKR